jgi:hypothetical protein
MVIACRKVGGNNNNMAIKILAVCKLPFSKLTTINIAKTFTQDYK